MEEVMDALRSIQKELDEQRKLINKSCEEVTENVTLNINKILNEKLKILEEKHENLKERVENQEQRIFFLEKQSRQRNLVFFGLEEREESYSDIENNIIGFVHKYLPTKIECRDLQAIRRIGKKTDKPRPIVITFTTLGKKIDILKHKGALKETTYYIKEDYPKQVLQIRRELQEQVKAEREKGNLAIIKYDKIILLKGTTTNINNNNKKRNLSKSPENKNSHAEQRQQANKKNKTLAAHTVHRSASFSEGVVKPGMLNFLINKNNNNKTGTQDKATNA